MYNRNVCHLLFPLGHSESAPTVHHEGWMVGGQETVSSWVPVTYLAMVFSSDAFLNYLFTNNPQAGSLLVSR
jgi:hypothetical protein